MEVASSAKLGLLLTPTPKFVMTQLAVSINTTQQTMAVVSHVPLSAFLAILQL